MRRLTLQLLPIIWFEYLNRDYCRIPSQEDSVTELGFGKGGHFINLNNEFSRFLIFPVLEIYLTLT